MMKKLCITFLAILFSLGLSVTGLAADTPEVLSVNLSFFEVQGAQQYALGAALLDDASPEDLEALSVHPGSEIRIQMAPKAFLASDGKTADTHGFRFVSADQLSFSGIRLDKRIESGRDVIRHVGLRGSADGAACITVTFVDEFVSTREAEFELWVSLAENGEVREETTIHIAGLLQNPEVEVTAQDEYVDLSGGTVATTPEYIKNIILDLGNSVCMNTYLFPETRYYGTVDVVEAAEGEELVENYPEVHLICSLRTVGLKREGGQPVHFDLPDKYYVYDSSGAYLGTSDRPLAYSSKYYLSVTQFPYLALETE